VGGLPDLRPVKVCIVTPAAQGSRFGNRVTALRWAGHLRVLGHQVLLTESWSGQACDVLVALHARKSFPSVECYRQSRPDGPLVVALTGTDLYEDLARSPEARRSLELADRLTVLQPLGIEALPAEVRTKARVVYQSAHAASPAPPPSGVFQACLLTHLREVKDPFLAAEALRHVPSTSRLRVLHLGASHEPEAEARARREMAANPRYVWQGNRPRAEALSVLAGSRLLLVTSRLEGGANVVSEALASNVPVLSTRIDGSVGILGPEYPGYFPVGDAAALGVLLLRAEEEAGFLDRLREAMQPARALVEPARERAAWRALLSELAGSTGGAHLAAGDGPSR
jgi:putative glycosyltransferase (TIGR04348 family)